MPLTPSSKLLRGGTAKPPGHTAGWMAVLLFAISPAGKAEEPTAAIWKAQEISFIYSSSTSIYSCGALRSRVESVLQAVGVNEDLKVSVSNCQNFFIPPDVISSTRSRRFGPSTGLGSGSSQAAYVRIRLRSPIPATPEAIAELDKTKGYRELLGRVTGNSVAIEEAVAQFPARRELVPLNYRTLRLEPEECELLEQMIREVFPKLGVRVVENSMVCIPRQVSMLRPRLKVEALVRLPPADAKVGELSVGEADDSGTPEEEPATEVDTSAEQVSKPPPTP
jgi:hypothetical protein